MNRLEHDLLHLAFDRLASLIHGAAIQAGLAWLRTLPASALLLVETACQAVIGGTAGALENRGRRIFLLDQDERGGVAARPEAAGMNIFILVRI